MNEEHSEAQKGGRLTRKSIKRKSTSSVKKTESKRCKNSTAAQFHEDEQEICMNVEVEDDSEEEGEIPEEDELVSDDPEITFNSQHSENNNASICEDSDLPHFSQHEDDSQQTNRNRDKFECERDFSKDRQSQFLSTEDQNQIIGEAINQAVAQVKEIFNKSGLMETANFLQEQLKRNNKDKETHEGVAVSTSGDGKNGTTEKHNPMQHTKRAEVSDTNTTRVEEMCII